MSNYEEILKKYEIEETNEIEKDIVETKTTQENGAIRFNVGLKQRTKQEKILENIYGHDYIIKTDIKVFKTISTIGKAMQKLKPEDRVEKLFDMIKDIIYLIFGKEDGDEILMNSVNNDPLQQIEELMLIIRYATVLITSKNSDDFNEKIKEVETEEATFRE